MGTRHLALGALLLAACADTPAPPFGLTFDASTSEADRALVLDAARTWNERVGETIFSLDAAAHGACDTVHIELVPSLYAAGVKLVGRTTSEGCDYTVRLTPDGLHDGSTVEHELGHTLGLGHTNDPTSIMYRKWTPYAAYITDSDALAVRARWGFGPPPIHLSMSSFTATD